MIDLRNFSTLIRDTIKQCSKEDEYYNWKVKAINKTEAKFQWGYLTDKDDPFILRVRDDTEDGDPYVIVHVPYSEEYLCFLIGNSRWDDAKTLEDGIRIAIRAAVVYAQHTF